MQHMTHINCLIPREEFESAIVSSRNIIDVVVWLVQTAASPPSSHDNNNI